MSKQVAVKEETQVVEQSMFSEALPSHIKQDGGRGQENVTTQDMVVPRLEILQDLSPRAKKREPEYVEGAEPGMMINSVSSELYGTKLSFIPVFFQLEWVIWKKQAAGGGFIGAFSTELEAREEWSRQNLGAEMFKNSTGQMEEAHEILDTAQQYGLIVHQGGRIEQIVCSMTKSKMKASRQLNTLISMAGNMDRFSKAYEASVVLDKNKAGQSYWNVKWRPLGFVPEALYREAEKMYLAVSKGNIVADRSSADEAISPNIADTPEAAY
jgi:hypothetical protein